MQNFNNYNNPYGYNNNYNNYGYQQPSYSQYQAPQTQLNTYAFVDGIEGAKAYQVKPNATMLLMDSQQPICYKKQVNHLGQTIDFQIFDLVPHQEPKAQQVEYVTLDLFNKEIADLKALISKGE